METFRPDFRLRGGYAGRKGDPIRIRASDEVAVAGVRVAIRDTAGAVVEEGSATLENDLWHYPARTTLPGQRESHN